MPPNTHRYRSHKEELSTTFPSEMLSSIAGRVYMITGAASGIGRETAITLAKLGAAGLAISDVNTNGLQETKEECNISRGNVPKRFRGIHSLPLTAVSAF